MLGMDGEAGGAAEAVARSGIDVDRLPTLNAPGGKRAGLVQDHGAQVGQGLEREAMAKRDAGLGQPSDGDAGRQRRCETKRAGAGNDENGEAGHQGDIDRTVLPAEPNRLWRRW